MKKIKTLPIALLLMLAACSETPAPNNGSTTNNFNTIGSTGTSTGTGGSIGTGTGTSTGTGGSTGTSTGTGGSTGGGTTCFGSAADGDNTGMLPIIDYDLNLAGGKSWTPTNVVTTGMLTIDNYSIPVFTSNYRLRFRVKIKSQPTSCPYKTSGTVSYPYYSKLKFDVNFHTIGSGNALNPAFHTIPNQMADVDSCSQIYSMSQSGVPGDFPNPQTAGPIYVSISNVRTDYECQYYDLENDTNNYYYDFYCPAERVARTKSCWAMTLQVVNDSTDNFK